MAASSPDQDSKAEVPAKKETPITRGAAPDAESGSVPGLNTLGQALTIIPKLPIPVQAVLYLAVIVAILGLAAGYELIYKDQYLLGAGLVAFAIAALAGDTFLA